MEKSILNSKIFKESDNLKSSATDTDIQKKQEFASMLNQLDGLFTSNPKERHLSNRYAQYDYSNPISALKFMLSELASELPEAEQKEISKIFSIIDKYDPALIQIMFYSVTKYNILKKNNEPV